MSTSSIQLSPSVAMAKKRSESQKEQMLALGIRCEDYEKLSIQPENIINAIIEHLKSGLTLSEAVKKVWNNSN